MGSNLTVYCHNHADFDNVKKYMKSILCESIEDSSDGMFPCIRAVYPSNSNSELNYVVKMLINYSISGCKIVSQVNNESYYDNEKVK